MIVRASALAAISGALVAVAIGVAPPAARSAFPGRDGVIAFQRERSIGHGGAAIFTIRPDGSGVRRLTPGHPISQHPSFSPGGHRIAFERRNSAGRSDIWVMHADGSDPHRVTDRPHNESNPGFSPTGRKIVFDGSIRGDEEIFTIRSNGSHLRQVTHNGADDFQPAFSPRGNRIAFVKQNPPSHPQIFTIHPDGSRLRQITHTHHRVSNLSPDFSPGGGRIVFDRRSLRGRVDGIYTIAIDGSDERRLSSPPHASDTQPAFSPSGRRIVFARFKSTGNILTMRADGSHRRRVTHNRVGVDSLLPDWQPLPR